MTRKTFFKTILGAVGGISALSFIQKKPVRQCFETYWHPKILADIEFIKAYRKGVKIAQDHAKDGDYTQITVAKQPYKEVKPYKITHIFPDGSTIKTEFDSNHWQSRASV